MTDEIPPVSASDDLKGIGIYRTVRAMVVSPILVPLFWGATFAVEPFSNGLGRFCYGLCIMLAFVTPLVVIAGVVIGAVAGSRDQLSDAIDRKMWRLVGVVAALTALLFWLAS